MTSPAVQAEASPENVMRDPFGHLAAKWENHFKDLVEFHRDQAKLVKLPNGQHDLIGGSDNDRASAFEWASLFAHEIVFTHFHRQEPARKTIYFPRFQPV